MSLHALVAVRQLSRAAPADRMVFEAIADGMGGGDTAGVITLAQVMAGCRVPLATVQAAIGRVTALGELTVDGDLRGDPNAPLKVHVLLGGEPPKPAPQPRSGHPPIPDRMRLGVFRRDDYTCKGCRNVGGDLTVDLVKPWSRGGKIAMVNMQTMCRSCNSSKGDRE